MHNVVPRVPVISGPQAIVSTTPGARADPVGLEWPHWCSCSTRFACRVAHLTAIPTNIRPRGDPGRARSDRGPHSGPLPKGAPHQRCRADSGMGQCRRRASRAGAGGARRRLPRHSEHETGTLGNDRPKTEPPCPTPNGPGGVPTRSLVGSCAASSETSSRMNCRLARRCPRSWSDTAVRPHRQPNLLITAVRRQGCPEFAGASRGRGASGQGLEGARGAHRGSKRQSPCAQRPTPTSTRQSSPPEPPAGRGPKSEGSSGSLVSLPGNGGWTRGAGAVCPWVVPTSPHVDRGCRDV